MSEIVQTGFDYGVLDEDTRVFLKVKAEAIRTRLKRTSEDIITIGQDLISVKEKLKEDNDNKKGLFLPWIKNEFGMSHKSATRFIHVAERFGSEKIVDKLSTISASVLYELAAPSTSDDIIESVTSGNLAMQAMEKKITLLEAIKEAKAKEAEDALMKAELAKAESETAKRELDLKQQQLILFQERKHLQDDKLQKLEETISHLKEEKAQIAASKVQTLQKDTPETEAKLAELEEHLQTLKTKQADILDQKKKKEDLLKQKTTRVKELTEELQKRNLEDRVTIHNKQIRYKWYQACEDFHLSINQGMARMVTPMDAQQAFESDDWARLAEVEATLKQALGTLGQLRESRTSQFVDGSMDYIEG